MTDDLIERLAGLGESMTTLKLIGDLQDRIEAQAAEIEQLREALEQIASGRYSGVMLTSFPLKDAAVEAARAALGDME